MSQIWKLSQCSVLCLFLSVFSLCMSCGNDEGNEAVPATSSVEETKSRNQSWMLAEFSDLPECTDEIVNQLAFVKAENKFYYCDKVLQWEVVVIDGKDGVDGVNGTNGIDGVNGTNGSDGVDDVNDVVSVPYMWEDIYDGTKWLIVGQVDAADVVCPSGFSVPDVLTLEPAYEHGLGNALVSWGVDPFVWVKNLSGANAGLVEAYKDMRFYTTVVSQTGAYLFCRKV